MRRRTPDYLISSFLLLFCLLSCEKCTITTEAGPDPDSLLVRVQQMDFSITMPERRICQGSDDAEEDVIPSTVTNNSPLWACCKCPASEYLCHITGVGLRFTDVQIPQGAFIKSAWLSVLPFISTNDDIACTVYCEEVVNCSTYVMGNFHNISNRVRTENSVLWFKKDASSSWVDSPDLSDIVHEVINKPNWSAGNALSFILIPGDSAGSWYGDFQLQAWELMDHSYGAKFNCEYVNYVRPISSDTSHK